MIQSFLEEHAELRRLAAEIEDALGPECGVGWDDCNTVDLKRLRAAQERLSRDLMAHEDRENRALAEAMSRMHENRADIAADMEKDHRTLSHLMSLLRTLSALCDGSHVYPLRTAASRVRAELDAHLAHEEQTLFPLLRRVQERGRRAPLP